MSEKHKLRTEHGNFYDIRPGSVGNYIIAYKVNTSAGSSGAALTVTSQDWEVEQLK